MRSVPMAVISDASQQHTHGIHGCVWPPSLGSTPLGFGRAVNLAALCSLSWPRSIARCGHHALFKLPVPREHSRERSTRVSVQTCFRAPRGSHGYLRRCRLLHSSARGLPSHRTRAPSLRCSPLTVLAGVPRRHAVAPVGASLSTDGAEPVVLCFSATCPSRLERCVSGFFARF